jgi:glycosyltransferase involved in cell wall biosynthesis
MRIGILFTGDYQWAGGIYYSLNIIKLLQELSVKGNFKIVVIINKTTPKELIPEITLQHVEIVNLDSKPFLYKAYCKLLTSLKHYNFRFVSDINSLNLSFIYPLLKYDVAHDKLNCKVFYWLYDFQHKFLPDLFSEDEIKQRDIDFKNVADKANNIVVSSFDSKKHFNQFYPESKANVHVFNFISLIDKSINQLHTSSEFNIPDKYFIVCNQFWPHKNHIVVVKALSELISNNSPAHIVFTGKNTGPSSAKVIAELTDYMQENKLNEYITFTGFISREKQIELIKNATAVIQPSKFEGWSTVVEDAKALNKFLIASDLPIHKEQVNENVLFFAPDDYLTLAKHLEKVNTNNNVVTFDYHKNIEQSKLKLKKLFGIQQ